MSRVKVRETTHVVTLRLSTDDYFWLKAVSAVTGESINALITSLVQVCITGSVDSAARKEIEATVARWKEQAAEIDGSGPGAH